LEAEPQPPELGHVVPVTDFSGPMLVNDGEQIDRIARTAADLPVTFDGGARSGRQFAQSLARFSPQLGVAVPHFVLPPFSFVSDSRKPFFVSLMFQKLGKSFASVPPRAH